MKLRNTAGKLQPLPDRGSDALRTIQQEKVSEFVLPDAEARVVSRARKFSIKKSGPDMNTLMVTSSANKNDAPNQQPNSLNFTSFHHTIGGKQDFNDYANTIISISDKKPDRLSN